MSTIKFTKQIIDRLRQRCWQTIPSLANEIGGTVWDTPDGTLAHKDNGSDILAVAHLDWVKVPWLFVKGEGSIFCPRLDDRLGVFTILDILPSLGIKVDILFTDSEEIGQSTAQYFQTEKQYKWLVEFDRRGDDVVTYDYNDPDWENAIGTCFRLGWGTFSDISHLGHLGASAMNIGVGYYREHSVNCHFLINEYVAQIKRFQKFHAAFHDTAFPHQPLCQTYDFDADDYLFCDECDHLMDPHSQGVCDRCGFDNVTGRFNYSYNYGLPDDDDTSFHKFS